MGSSVASPVTRSRCPRAGWAVLLLALNSVCARAQAEAAEVDASADASTLPGRAGTKAAASLPPQVTLERGRLATDDSAARAGDGDVHGRHAPVELAGVSYRWWVGRGASNFGLGLGAVGSMPPAPEARIPGTRQAVYAASLLTLGWRYRVNGESTLFADASGARRFFSNDSPDRYTTKLGLEWKGKTSRFGIDGGSRSLGLQLDSGYRMSLRVKRHGVAVHLRGQF